MALFKDVAEAFIASREWDQATLSRLAFWCDVLGPRDTASITPEDIDAVAPEACGARTIEGRQGLDAGCAEAAGATINRYLAQAGSIFKFARRLRLVPRAFVFPTRGIERAPEPVDPDRCLREEEVEHVVKVARVLDKRWGKMVALIIVAYQHGATRRLPPGCARQGPGRPERHAHNPSDQERGSGSSGALDPCTDRAQKASQGGGRRADLRQPQRQAL
jgi:hypothetical protein